MRIATMIALMLTASPRAYMSDHCETVIVKGADGQPLRVNKADYDADQAEGGAKSMTLIKDQDQTQFSGAAVQTFDQLGIAPVAAPSAPDFSGGATAPAVVDPRKDAAAPVAPSPNQRLVAKEGNGAKAKYFIIDGTGTKLEGPGIEAAGYSDEGTAWAAVMALGDAGNTGVNPAT